MADPGSDPNWLSPDGQYLYDYNDNNWYVWTTDPGYGDSLSSSYWEQTTPPPGLTAPPLQWSPSDANHPSDHPKPSGSGPTPPPVPGGTGNGGSTSVDTPSLDLFAGNIKSLMDPVSTVTTKLRQMTPVQPGAFYHADLIRTNISGDNGDAGIQAKYHTALVDLGNGLQDLHDAIVTLSKKYTSTEDANKGTAKDVTQALQQTGSYFGGVVTDAGGTGGPGPGG